MARRRVDRCVAGASGLLFFGGLPTAPLAFAGSLPLTVAQDILWHEDHDG